MKDMGPEYDSGDYSQFLAEGTGEYKDDKKIINAKYVDHIRRIFLHF